MKRSDLVAAFVIVALCLAFGLAFADLPSGMAKPEATYIGQSDS